jgi:hypothetical protein
MAVLKVIADKHGRHRDAIGDVSGTSCGTVKSAVRTTAAEGLIKVEQGSCYHTITVSPTWKAWLDLYDDAPPDGPRG